MHLRTPESYHRAWSAILLSLVTLIIAFCAIVLLRAQQASASLPTTSNSTNTTITAPSSSLGCTLDWRLVPSPNIPSVINVLRKIAAISATDIWAVGNTGTQQGTLIMHWNGQEWTIVPSPNPGPSENHISDIDAIASNNVWAVGEAGDVVGDQEPFVIHWDGTAWSQVAVPGPGRLYAIEAISANDIWVAGEGGTDPNSNVLMLHWNGSTWSPVFAPEGGDMWNIIESMEAVSANDIWAVGNYRTQETGTNEKAYILHWNGTAWALVSNPVPTSPLSSLYEIDPISANDIWAVGLYFDSSDGNTPLIIHWNGTAWSVVSHPVPALAASTLTGITALASNDAWAVGHYPGPGNTRNTYTIHWNGTAWAQVTDVDTQATPLDIHALAADDVWAVGTTWPGNLSFIEHYSSDCPVATPTTGPTNTPPPVPTNTPTVPTATPTNTATPEPPRCPGERFTDVCPGDYFYDPVLALNDDGIINGYNSSPPCDGPDHIPCFKPYNNVTRAQVAKIIALAAGFTEPVTTQSFEDVPINHTFYEVVERMAARSIISGYPCGMDPSEPCGPGNLPYFRPAGAVTRGQITKMATLSFNFNEPVSGQSFEDVPVGSTFYTFIARMSARGIINGYPCGNPNEPCGPGNLPYFRPTNPVTRGQTAKIVDLARAQVTPTTLAK